MRPSQGLRRLGKIRGWWGAEGLRGLRGPRGLRRLTRERYPQSFLECLSHQDSENIAH